MSVADEIRENMAKAFFGSAWADACEEAGEFSQLSGAEILDVMPVEIDPAAIHAARTLAFDIERANGGKSLEELLTFVQENAAGDREPSAEMFGHYCAMQAMGHGVGLGDAFGRHVYETIRVPYVEFSSCSLERDYFSGEGEDSE